MPQIPTPPASRPGSETPEVGLKSAEASPELLASLDTLLEQYLHLLDRQQKLHSGLSKQLSSGFLALAHANYTCPPGRRYGRDYYDERMKTNKKIYIQAEEHADEAEHSKDSLEEADTPPSNDLLYNFHIESVSNREAEKAEEKKDAEKLSVEDKQTEAPSQQEEIQQEVPTKETSETTPSAAEYPSAVVDTDKSAEEPKKPRKKFRSDDPIYWYGILVPPSLRNAQKSFAEGIRTQVPELAGTIVEMRALEQKITQLRAKLGSSTKSDLQ